MGNSWYITQYRVDNLTEGKPLPEHTTISQVEFTKLIRQQWPATPDPDQLSKDSWCYCLRKTDDEQGFGELNFWGEGVSERKLGIVRFAQVAITLQKYVSRPLYLWNDSDEENFMEITDNTTQHDIFSFFNCNIEENQ